MDSYHNNLLKQQAQSALAATDVPMARFAEDLVAIVDAHLAATNALVTAANQLAGASGTLVPLTDMVPAAVRQLVATRASLRSQRNASGGPAYI